MSRLTAENSVQEWAAAIGAPTPAPAGGSAAAIAAALAAALVAMVAGLTRRRPAYLSVHSQAQEVYDRAATLQGTLLALAARDAGALADYVKARALPQGTEAERTSREAAIRRAGEHAGRVQLDLVGQVTEVAALAETMADAGFAPALGDAATAAFLAGAAARSAYWAARGDLDQDRDAAPTERDLQSALEMVERVEAVERHVRQILAERVR